MKLPRQNCTDRTRVNARVANGFDLMGGAMRLTRHDNSDWLLRCTPVATASRLAFGSGDTVVGC